MELWKQIEDACRNGGLFEPGERVLVACSGGADSLFLAEALHRLSERLGVSIGIAHVDHGLRGEASKEDASFVARFAAERQLPYFQRDLLLLTKRSPRGIEALARERRYEALESIALEQGYDRVAAAHHADDQIETVLLRILQGAEPRHWTGMRAVRPIREGSPLFLIRPLLGLRREEIESCLRVEGIAWREDATNRNPRFLRSRLRVWLSKLDDELRQEIEQEVLFLRDRAASLSEIERRFGEALLRPRLRQWETSLWLDLAGLPQLPAWFLRPIVERLLRRMGGECPQGTIDAVCRLWIEGRTGAIARDPSGIEIRRRHESLEFVKTIVSSAACGSFSTAS